MFLCGCMRGFECVSVYVVYAYMFFIGKSFSSSGLLFLLMNSNPLYFSDLIYYSTRSGHEFLRYSDVVHKHSEEVILSRRKELLEVYYMQTVFTYLYASQASQRTQPRKFLDFMDILLSAKVR